METCDRNGNCINDAPTYAQEHLADIERREAVNHPDYYKRGGVEAWNLDFCLGNTVKYIARCGNRQGR